MRQSTIAAPSEIVFGVDAGCRTLDDADALITALAERLRLPATATVCTHALRDHITVSISVPAAFAGVWNELTRVAEQAGAGVASRTGRSGRPELAAAAAQAAAEQEARRGGRAVVFPGSALLTGTVRFGELPGYTAISRVTVVGGTQPGEDDLLETGGRVRPRWCDGELVLTVKPVAGGHFAPFDIPAPREGE